MALPRRHAQGWRGFIEGALPSDSRMDETVELVKQPAQA